jgi:transcriptional regulator with XRE-family HTH domain
MPAELTGVALEPRQQEFLRWLLDPRSSAKPERDNPEKYKGSQNDYARRKRMSPNTLSAWKRDPHFRAAWEEQLQRLAGGPERLQLFLQELTKIAVGEDAAARSADRIAAMKLHLEVVGNHRPKTIVEIRDPRLAAADDDDLLARARRHADRIAQASRVATGNRGNVVQLTERAGRG